jgi:hypothetical protein
MAKNLFTHYGINKNSNPRSQQQGQAASGKALNQNYQPNNQQPQDQQLPMENFNDLLAEYGLPQQEGQDNLSNQEQQPPMNSFDEMLAQSGLPSQNRGQNNFSNEQPSNQNMQGNSFDQFGMASGDFEQQENNTQQQGSNSALENFARNNPKLAEFLGNMQWPKSKGFQKAGEIAGMGNKAIEKTGLPALAGGLLQGLGNTGISTANLIPGAEIPHLDLRKFSAPGALNSVMHGAGNIGGNLAGFFGAGAGLGKIGQALNIARPTGKTGMLADFLKNAGTGYATGENADHGKSGRIISAVLSTIPTAANWMSDKKNAAKVLADKESVFKAGNKMYDKVFDMARKEGITHADKAPSIDINTLKKYMDKSFSESLTKMMDNPTLRNLHNAQSDLGKYIGSLKSDVGKLPSGNINAFNKAVEARDIIKNLLKNTLNKSSSKELAKELTKASDYWKNTVSHYYDFTKDIWKFSNNKTFPSTFLKGIKNVDDVFAKNMAGRLPEVMLKDFLKDGSKKITKVGAAAGTIYGVKKGIDLLDRS